MPAYRLSDAPRRSRRLSKMSPRKYDEDGYETFDLALLTARYPSESTDASYSPHPPCPPSDCPSPSPPPPNERRLSASKSRKHSEDHIRRPPNSFMVFRSDFWDRQKHNPTERDHREISKMAGSSWRSLPAHMKEHWRHRAAAIKAEHSRKYPDYKYSPNPRRKPRVQKKKGSRSDQKEVKRCEEVAERLMRGVSLEHGVECSTSPRPTASPAASSSPVEVKVESPEPSLAPLPIESMRVASPSFPVVGDHFISPFVAGDLKVEENMELQYPDFVKHEDESDSSRQEPVYVPTEDIPVIDLPARAIFGDFSFVPTAAPVLKEQSPCSSPRVSTPVLPSNHEIDNYFGCKPDVYNLEPQQTIFTNPNGYTEVSSFSGVEQFGYATSYDVPQPQAYYTQVNSYHDNLNFAVPPTYYSHPEVGTLEGDSFDEDLLRELAQSNASYQF
ncbi:hypothetical protein AAF712_009844 [Marasmius tenuissimus]|uniref:HMG box domain-containing protein n=1 Tax=Marasmius tenuissimus TaxID=585030 RepID=A0ABR2ZNL0_9AGAR|nr:hypothetical protein PM082_015111 [Marasmius tenuissimus]